MEVRQNSRLMEKIIQTTAELFKTAGLRYEALKYNQYRNAQSKGYSVTASLPKPETSAEELARMDDNAELVKLEKIMYHIAEIKQLLK